MYFECILEAIGNNGKKVLQFTKGKIYSGIKNYEGDYEIIDDNGNFVSFQCPFRMFIKTTIKMKDRANKILLCLLVQYEFLPI